MKTGRPVLYELLRDQKSTNPESTGHLNGQAEVDEPSEQIEPAGRLLAAGRSIRIPVGWLFVVVAGLIFVTAAGYAFGFLRGQDPEDESISSRLAEEENNRIGRELAGTDRRQTPDGGAGVVRPPSGPVSPVGDGNWGAVRSDPRVAGLNYYRLIQTSRNNAIKVAEFCRENRVEAYVVPANNDFVVYVAPGFRAEDRDSTTVRSLKDGIERVRRLWMAKYNKDDLKGYFPALHK